jgi:hypothetical protein
LTGGEGSPCASGFDFSGVVRAAIYIGFARAELLKLHHMGQFFAQHFGGLVVEPDRLTIGGTTVTGRGSRCRTLLKANAAEVGTHGGFHLPHCIQQRGIGL